MLTVSSRKVSPWGITHKMQCTAGFQCSAEAAKAHLHRRGNCPQRRSCQTSHRIQCLQAHRAGCRQTPWRVLTNLRSLLICCYKPAINRLIPMLLLLLLLNQLHKSACHLSSELIRRSLSNSISGETPHHLLKADAQQIWVNPRPVTSLL